MIRSADAMTGQVFDGRYRILHKIGEGGMGAVYKARQVSTGKLVAIKVISESLAGNLDTIRRFQREVKLQSRLEHPNIVTVIDFSTTEQGQCYFVMGFVEGKSLRRIILDDGKFSIKVFLDLASQMLDGLEYAHNQGIVHRDLKADNMTIVTLKHQRIVKILDFGLAKAFQTGGQSMDIELTQQGRVLGTPAYMSPEQAKGETKKIGPASDIYSMGVIFYQMLSGKLPFQSDTPWGIMHKHISDTPVSLRQDDPGIPERVEKVVMQCLAKEPQDRYPSALAVKLDLMGEAADESTIAEATVIAAPEPEKKSSKTVIAAGLAVLLVFGGGLIWKFYGGLPESKPPEAVKVSKKTGRDFSAKSLSPVDEEPPAVVEEKPVQTESAEDTAPPPSATQVGISGKTAAKPEPKKGGGEERRVASVTPAGKKARKR